MVSEREVRGVVVSFSPLFLHPDNAASEVAQRDFIASNSTMVPHTDDKGQRSCCPAGWSVRGLARARNSGSVPPAGNAATGRTMQELRGKLKISSKEKIRVLNLWVISNGGTNTICRLLVKICSLFMRNWGPHHGACHSNVGVQIGA